MTQWLYIICVALCCGTLCGKPISRVAEKLPAEVQKHVDAIQSAAKSNDWASVRQEYDQINWLEVKKPAVILESLSKELKGDKGVQDLRREIKTKYQLLREEGDTDLNDTVAETPIPVVQYTVQRFPAMEINQLELVTIDVPTLLVPGLQHSCVDIMTLDPEVLKELGILVPVVANSGVSVIFLRVKDERFLALMDLWEKRYGKQIDYWDDNGGKILPAPGSVLWAERKAVMEAVEAGGDYDALWDAYNEHFQTAIARRINLKRSRR